MLYKIITSVAVIEPQQRKSVWSGLWKTEGVKESCPWLPVGIETSEVMFVGTRELSLHFARPELYVDLPHKPNELLLFENQIKLPCCEKPLGAAHVSRNECLQWRAREDQRLPPAVWVSLGADHLSVEPWDDCSPGRHLDCRLVKDPKSEASGWAISRFLTTETVT